MHSVLVKYILDTTLTRYRCSLLFWMCKRCNTIKRTYVSHRFNIKHKNAKYRAYIIISNKEWHEKYNINGGKTNVKDFCFQILRFGDTYITAFFVPHFRNPGHVRRLYRPKRRYTFPSFFFPAVTYYTDRAFKVLSNRRTNVHGIFLVSLRPIALRCCDSPKSQSGAFPFPRVRSARFKFCAAVTE